MSTEILIGRLCALRVSVVYWIVPLAHSLPCRLVAGLPRCVSVVYLELAACNHLSRFAHLPEMLFACRIIHSSFFGRGSALHVSGTPESRFSNSFDVTSPANGLDASHSLNADATVANRIAGADCSTAFAAPV